MPRTAALLGILTCLAPLACGATIHPGLANVPALGTTPAVGAGAGDVVANGRDSCQRGPGLGPGGPLRYAISPCPGFERPNGGLTVANRAPSALGIVMPSVERYYSRWPCSSSLQESSRENETGRMLLARLASPDGASDFALSRPSCVWK